MSKQLTPQQAKFCSYYIETVNARQSALNAGYSESTANNANSILKNSAITGRIAENEKNIIRASNWNKDRIISELERVYSLAIADNQLTNANKTLELLAKLTSSMPNTTTKELNMNVKFESLLKDITPQYQTVTQQNESKLIN